MFVWQKRAGARWLADNEERLREIAGARLAIVQAANHKTAIAEIAGMRRRDLENIRAQFGGTITGLPRDWLARFGRAQKTKPFSIGKRLIIVRSRSTTVGRAHRLHSRLIIPAGRAFGTGEHATTAMSLRLLEQLSRKLANGWSMLDLGTGSGILALAAKKFGAGKVLAIDSDRIAIATAKENARLNGTDGIDFRVGDARKLSLRKFDVCRRISTAKCCSNCCRS